MKLDADNKARIAFVLLLLLLAAGGLGWHFISASQHAVFQLLTHDPVSGLIPDAPIEYHGVEVGRVKQVDLIDSRSIRVLLSIRKDAPITTATVATITSRGLATRGFTGYVYVALEDEGTDFQPLLLRPGEPYPTIPTTSSKAVDLDLMISQVNENVKSLTALAQGILDKETIASLKASVDGLQRVTKTLAANSARLNTLIANGERASHQLPPLLQSSQEAVNALQPLLKSSRETVSALQPLVQSSQDTVNALQMQLMPQAYKTLTDLNNLTASLNGFTARVSNDPSIVIRGASPRPPGPGERQ